MTPVQCSREHDVMDAIQAARWPDRLDDDLRAHLASCAICRDLALVMAPVREDAAAAMRQVRVPDAGAVWLRAQVRARAEAARKAGRPITAAQVIAFTTAAAGAGAVFGASSAWFQSWLAGAWTFVKRFDPSALAVPAPIVALVTNHLGLAAIALAGLLLAPVAVYLAGQDD